MPSKLKDICFDCADPASVARFWAAVLGYEMKERGRGEPVPLVPRDPKSPKLWFNPVPESKLGKNRVHIDVTMPDSAEMDRLIGLGARKLEEIRDSDGKLQWTIIADVEGNEFCAFPPS